MAVKKRSVKYNVILNWINTVVGIMFPIVTFPYISRVIGPEGLGIMNFDQSIINYIGIIASLEISLYAIRQVSKVRDNEPEQFKCAVEILLLHLFLIVLGYVAVAVIYFTVPNVSAHGTIFLVLSIQLIFNTIGANWFFQAREDFKYIMIRALSVKLLAAISLFLFVKTDEDLIYYALIISLSDVANYTLNFIRLSKIIRFKDIEWSRLHIFRHLRPAVVVFAMSFAMKFYIDLPVLFLGFECEEVNVGYYTTASKLVTVAVLLVSALGTAMLPRMSHYFAAGDVEKFRELGHNGMTFVIGLTLPICIAMMVIAPELIYCFSGDRFAPSVDVLRIIAPNVLFIGIATIAGLQILYPQGKEIFVVRSAVLGLLVSIVCNLLLTHVLAQIGAAYSFLATEFVVVLTVAFLGRRFIAYRYLNGSVIKYLASAAFMTVVLLALHCYCDVNVYAKLVIEVIAGVAVYAVSLLLFKDTLFINLAKPVVYKILRKPCCDGND